MNKLIKYFNKNYGKEYGKVSYPRTTIQIYQVYQIIKSYGIKDEELLTLLGDLKLPKPKTIEEKEAYAECIYESVNTPISKEYFKESSSSYIEIAKTITISANDIKSIIEKGENSITIEGVDLTQYQGGILEFPSIGLELYSPIYIDNYYHYTCLEFNDLNIGRIELKYRDLTTLYIYVNDDILIDNIFSKDIKLKLISSMKKILNGCLPNDIKINNSISIGRTNTSKIGYGSTAIGSLVEASGECSHAEGSCVYVKGQYSHAEGCNITVNSDYSHAEGYGTIVSSDYQHVQGQHNIEDTNNKYAHIVGNGTNEKSRSNAHTLDWKGNAWYAGKLSQEGTPTEDKDLITKKYFDDKIPQLSFNKSGELVVTINGVTKTFVPKSEVTQASYDEKSKKIIIKKGE